MKLEISISLKKPLYYYRIHEKGLSHDQTKVNSKPNLNIVIQQALVRRGIKYMGKMPEIKNIQHFIFSKQNTFFKKLMRKISW